MPIPAIASAASPTRVRNSPIRLTNRSAPGEAVSRVRMSNPASGKRFSSAAFDRFRVGAAGELHPRLGLVERARGGQAGALGQVVGDDHRLSELKTLAQPVGLLADDAADLE